MKLIGSLTSPFVRKVRIFLHEKSIPFDFEVCDVWAPDSIVPSKNPLSLVPVLELDDGPELALDLEDHAVLQVVGGDCRHGDSFEL